jgi:hypothetical protein
MIFPVVGQVMVETKVVPLKPNPVPSVISAGAAGDPEEFPSNVAAPSF